MPLISCQNCHKVFEKENYNTFVCNRCNHHVRKRTKHSLQVSIALVVCAILLYIPALLYPMMIITKLGLVKVSTIMGGIIDFIDDQNYFIAGVIFFASIIIPVTKLTGLLIIFISLKINIKISNKAKIRILKFIEYIGKWSMIDIYVVAILASVVNYGEVFNIKGGLAATSFTLVVIITMIAAQRFDTRIIWDEQK